MASTIPPMDDNTSFKNLVSFRIKITNPSNKVSRFVKMDEISKLYSFFNCPNDRDEIYPKGLINDALKHFLSIHQRG